MVNSQVTSEIVDALKLDVRVDKIPEVTPVVEVGIRKASKGTCFSTYSTSTGIITIGTAALAGGNTFVLTGFCVAFTKNILCDIATGQVYVTCVPEDKGVITTIFTIPVITLTSAAYTQFIPLEHPIKLQKGSGVIMGGTFGAGIMVRSLTILGYIDEVD